MYKLDTPGDLSGSKTSISQGVDRYMEGELTSLTWVVGGGGYITCKRGRKAEGVSYIYYDVTSGTDDQIHIGVCHHVCHLTITWTTVTLRR